MARAVAARRFGNATGVLADGENGMAEPEMRIKFPRLIDIELRHTDALLCSRRTSHTMLLQVVSGTLHVDLLAGGKLRADFKERVRAGVQIFAERRVKCLNQATAL